MLYYYEFTYRGALIVFVSVKGVDTFDVFTLKLTKNYNYLLNQCASFKYIYIYMYKFNLLNQYASFEYIFI